MSVTGYVIATVTVILSLSRAPVAAAESPADPVLFAAGVPVFEVAARILHPNSGSSFYSLAMRRLRTAQDGIPGSPRYVIVGCCLPDQFGVAERYGPTGANVPFGVITMGSANDSPLIPVTINVLSTPNGGLPGLGFVGPYLP